MAKACTPANIYGPFTQTLFLGCSVRSFNCTVGWNEQTTSLSVDLIEDPCAGNKVYYPYPGATRTWTQADPGFEAYQPTIGAPVYFKFGEFEFAGVVQSWMKKDDSGGLGQYNVNISDPRFILQNTQVILNEFNGNVGGSYNVFNAFGFLEQHGFGSSDVNEVGVPWNLIKLATSTLTTGLKDASFGPHGALAYRAHDWNTVSENFGLLRDPLTDTFDPSLITNFGGNGWFTGYFVDLHDIPFAPSIYRLQGSDMTLLDIISQVCGDAGCDYYIEMFVTPSKEKIIKVRTQARKAQPTLGQIQQFVDTREGVIAKNVGRELRNEPTASFAYGANKQYFYEATSYEPYWGVDSAGNLQSWSTVTSVDGFGTIYNVVLDITKLNANLANPIATDTINLLETEMRAAIAGYEEWREYVLNYNNAARTNTGAWLYSNGMRSFFPQNIDWNDINIEDGAKAAAMFAGFDNLLAALSFDENVEADAKKAHAFIAKFADEHYGRKAIVPIEVDYYFNTESQKNFFEALPASEAWIEDGGTWLGLTKPSVYLDKFTTDQNLISAGVRHNPATNGAYVQDDGNAITDGTYIYTNASVESDIVIKAPAGGGVTQTWAIVDFGTVAFRKTQEIGYEDLMAMPPILLKNFGANPARITGIMSNLSIGGNMTAMGFAKKRLYPERVAVPLRSNYSRYGPFAYLGPPGPVNMKPDDSLNPWEYDGSLNMLAVANAQSQDGLTFMQVGERGSVNWPGYPEHRIGAELRSSNTQYSGYSVSQYFWAVGLSQYFYYYIDLPGSTGSFGPNITSVNMNIGEGGVTTTYELSTFTPSFGRLSKINTERLKSAAKQRVMQSKMARQMAFMRNYTQMARNRSRINRG
jgi:hypothetical protein